MGLRGASQESSFSVVKPQNQRQCLRYVLLEVDPSLLRCTHHGVSALSYRSTASEEALMPLLALTSCCSTCRFAEMLCCIT